MRNLCRKNLNILVKSIHDYMEISLCNEAPIRAYVGGGFGGWGGGKPLRQKVSLWVY